MTQAAQRVTAGEAERAVVVEEAVHSVEMEGLDVTPETAADAADYVSGRISVAELVERVRVRHGAPESSSRVWASVGRG